MALDLNFAEASGWNVRPSRGVKLFRDCGVKVMGAFTQHEAASSVRRLLALAARAPTLFKQFSCGLHGHDMLLHFERRRVSLKCVTCGHESPGWSMAPTTPKPAGQITGRLRAPLAQPRRVA